MLEIFCLMVSGSGLSDAMRNRLLKTACEMFREKRKKATLKAEDCDGKVYTTFEAGGVGSISGTVFLAVLERPEGKTSVKYLVRTEDLARFDPKDAFWLDWGNATQQLRRAKKARLN